MYGDVTRSNVVCVALVVFASFLVYTECVAIARDQFGVNISVPLACFLVIVCSLIGWALLGPVGWVIHRNERPESRHPVHH